MAARLEGRTPFHTPRGGPSPETGHAAREDRPQAKGSKTGVGSADHKNVLDTKKKREGRRRRKQQRAAAAGRPERNTLRAPEERITRGACATLPRGSWPNKH